ncbi:PhzF family phenazine biosynthesis protein [Microbispora sp. ATCC PTA-5024]|uniref:PhzF family phenazine biosynthesis protein n=1 Tax=Microbispora sp. ATCC PTA-5024 TaxID=316330 RepID=UPI0003DCB1AB|nr:PhzF family phenazine biosynthesis protein [Microbispora sp. ATCC PTA-5024]ETK34950.1 phenazine biosynthesis protein [Microbispora sp. ATCC PTA-5024]
MTDCLLAHAFMNADGSFGNPALVVVEPEGVSVTREQRQALATRLGIPAVVFVQNLAHGIVSIHGNYGQEIQFGGHPLLATVEVLHRLGTPVKELTPAAGPVNCRRDPDGMVWLKAPAAWSKPWRHLEMESPAIIDSLTELPPGEDFTQVWAWMNREAGKVRARLWAPRIGKGEDEACGSASMLLALKLGRDLEVVHGQQGSIIFAKPVDDVEVELGGRCTVEEPDPATYAQVAELYGDRVKGQRS